MLYPIMPIYLKTIGFSVLLIGILEGIAEMIAGLSKGYFGQLSDIRQKRLPFVQLGYLLSAISKPMLALFTYPLWIFFSRTTDRFGKGLRSAPRDALLSSMTTNQTKASVFGFHRSMDTLGAVLGPIVALIYLSIFPAHYKTLFLIAFLPGMVAVLFTLFLKEKPAQPIAQKINFFSFLKYGFGKQSDPQFKKLLIGLIGFALVNSSDILLLLKMKESGVDDQSIIIVYIFYNLVFALASFPIGILADKIGISKIFILGLILFAIVYAGFAFTDQIEIYWILFFIYGIYAACSEGISKAWISRLVPATETATAIGTYSALASISALIASSLAGFLWYQFGSIYAFSFTAGVVLLLIFYFAGIRKMSLTLHDKEEANS